MTLADDSERELPPEELDACCCETLEGVAEEAGEVKIEETVEAVDEASPDRVLEEVADELTKISYLNS